MAFAFRVDADPNPSSEIVVGRHLIATLAVARDTWLYAIYLTGDTSPNLTSSLWTTRGASHAMWPHCALRAEWPIARWPGGVGGDDRHLDPLDPTHRCGSLRSAAVVGLRMDSA
jgi:hypothetical protein